jgi:hypothetical protein
MLTKRILWQVLMVMLLAGAVPMLQYVLESRIDAPAINIDSLPSRDLSPFDQMAQALAGLVIKPIYMVLSLVIILVLIGQKSADLSALQWGLVAFLVGETFCAINFYLYRHASLLSEYLHSYGMVLAFGFTSFAVLEGFDSRILHLSSSTNAGTALTVSGRSVHRKARLIARLIILMLAILTWIPLLSPLQPDAYAVSIFGFPYSYARLDEYEILERRVLPVLALISLLIAYLPLLRNTGPPIPFLTKIFFCAGLGASGFSLLRVALNVIFINNLVWFEFWEEAIELIYVGAAAFLLWELKSTLLESTPILRGMGFDPEGLPAKPSHEPPQA